MKKSELIERVDDNMLTTHDALQTIWDNINKGQKKQIRKIPECQELLERYEVED